MTTERTSLLVKIARPFGFVFFNSGGSTGYVLVRRNGKTINSGIGWSGFIKDGDSVAVIPTTPLVIPFSTSGAMTKDNQLVNAAGDVKVRIISDSAPKHFDYTMDPETGEYSTNPERSVIQPIVNALAAPLVRATCGSSTVADLVKTGHAAVQTALDAIKNSLKENGLEFISATVSSISPIDSKLTQDLGATERERITTEADTARHARQMAAQENADKLREVQDQAEREAEKRRVELLAAKRENDLTEAGTEAEVLAKKMAPLTEAGAQIAFVMALHEMADGNIGTLNVGPELLTLLSQTRKE